MDCIDSVVGEKTRSHLRGKLTTVCDESLNLSGVCYNAVDLSFLITLLGSASHFVGVVMELSGWEPPWPDSLAKGPA